jgi:hypothetical protein
MCAGTHIDGCYPKEAYHIDIEIITGRMNKDVLIAVRILLSFSRQLLFWDTPRLQSSGWRWAPLSFLEFSLQKKAFVLGKSQQCARKREGLEAECIAFRIDKANFPKSRALHEVGPILSLHSAGGFGFGHSIS